MQVIYVILAQGLLGAVLAGVFIYFSRIYNRVFLRTLGWSWLAFCVYMLVSALITSLFRPGSADLTRLFLSVVAQLGCYLQIAFLLIAGFELIRQRPCNRPCFMRVVVGVTALAVVTSVLYAFDAPASQERYLLRVGSRTVFSGIGFMVAAGLAGFKRAFTPGVGKMLLTVSLAVYGSIQLYYFTIVVLTIAGYPATFPPFFGLFELFAISLVGIGMVIWLLENERERLRKTNQELDRFLYSTLHDLRAPIASVLGLTQIARNETNVEQLRHYNELIEDRVRKLDTVIGDILALSRSTKADLNLTRINFYQLVEEAMQDIKFHTGSNQIEIRFPQTQETFFVADAAQMKIVLANLLGNAVKYHNLQQEKPYIEIDCQHRPAEFVVWVKDNGEGIPAELQPRIFDMFFRASRKTDGTGLGLYIVKEALEKIGGRIELHSVYGQGSTFTVRIPKN